MKGRCPKCDQTIEIEQAVRDQASRDLLKEVATLGPLASLALEYVESFRARPDASLAPAKALRIMREVRDMLAAGELVYDGRRTRFGAEQMDAALREMSARNLIGLKNHNYLKMVLLGIARKTPTAAAPHRPPARPITPPAPPDPEDRITREEAQSFVQQITKGIGKTMPKGEE